MNKSFAAPTTIRRIAARRVFQSTSGKPVVLTIGVPQLAMKYADATLESAKPELEWFGQKGDLGMPKFLPYVPKPQQDRLEALVEREADRFWRGVERAHKAKRSKKSTRRPTSQR